MRGRHVPACAPRWVRAADDLAALARVAGEVDFPCTVKGAMGHEARSGGGHVTRRVDTPEQLMASGTAALADGHRLLVTEFVPGRENRLEGAITVRAADGSYALSYGRRKIRQYPPDYGAVTLMVCEPSTETVAMARRLLDHVGFVGVSSLEAKRHEHTGEIVLIEVNVRLPQSWGCRVPTAAMAAAACTGPWRGWRRRPRPSRGPG